jgi:hypothetical protein
MDEEFVQIGPTLINVRRLVAVGPSPKTQKGLCLAVFDTGQELAISPEHARALAAHCQSLYIKPSEGSTAISSEVAT